MTWQVVEQFVETKISGRTCEDIIVVTESFAAVIDGASDATGAVFGSLSGGRLAAETIASTITTMDPHVTAREFADQATEALRAAVGDVDTSTRWPAACVVCLSFERNEVWRIGDCQMVLDAVPETGSLIVNDVAYRFRAAVNAALLASGTPMHEILSHDPGAKAARGLIDIQQHLANGPGRWAYGCVNGRPIPDRFVEVFSVQGIDQVILASDGYPVLEPSLRESEDRLHALLKLDPAAIDELHEMGKSLRPGANSLDDRAYLRLRREYD